MNLTDEQIQSAISKIRSFAPLTKREWTLVGELGAQAKEANALRRGEFICQKCGLRKDGEPLEADF